VLPENPSYCLTHWVVDDHPLLETAQVRAALERIRRQLPGTIPSGQREHLCAALLEQAVARIAAPQVPAATHPGLPRFRQSLHKTDD